MDKVDALERRLKYHQILTRVNKVILSCTNPFQLPMARCYCNRLVRRLPEPYDISTSLNRVRQLRELLSHIRYLIDRRRFDE